jgi:arginase family enzyme
MFANLGEAYEEAGRPIEARTAYRQGARRGSPVCREAFRRLDEELAAAPPATRRE